MPFTSRCNLADRAMCPGLRTLEEILGSADAPGRAATQSEPGGRGDAGGSGNSAGAERDAAMSPAPPARS